MSHLQLKKIKEEKEEIIWPSSEIETMHTHKRDHKWKQFSEQQRLSNE
jgi:hypothetical protein